MNELGMRIAQSKRRGEWAEMRFMERAAERGLCVSKPWGETSQYDFVVETAGKLWRIQVKSTWSINNGVYVISVRNGKGAYPPGAFDFVAAYLIPVDLWYIVPENKLRGKLTIGLYAESHRSKYMSYRDAWKLLTGGETADETSPILMTGSHDSSK
jgi:PD-(D/E)XK endonuclease